MRYLAIILFSSLSLLMAKPSSLSVGMHESLGFFGFISQNHEISIERWENGKNHLYLVGGFFILPFTGGTGISWKHYFNSSKVSPFSTLSMFGIYVIPFCQAEGADCDIGTDMLLSSSLGLDLDLIELKRLDLNVQFGVLSMYSMGKNEIYESPSDKPSIWPIMNIKFGF